MRELLTTLDEWAAADPEVAIATVVRTTGSTPRPVGARMAVSRDGRMAGSVSGGCLEGAVVEEALATLEGRARPRVLHYGISDELGWEVGLACGGSVDVLLHTLRWDAADPAQAALRAALEARRAAAVLTVLEGDHAGSTAVVGEEGGLAGSLGTAALDAAAAGAAAGRLDSGQPGVEEVDGVPVYVEPHVPAPVLAVVGAVHIGIALVGLATALGYRVVVIDPRTAFLTEERLGEADELIARWPDDALPGLGLGPRDAAVCLSHDAKFDEPTLDCLLRSPVGYIGAIGSRTTHGKRVARLRESGFTDADIARVHSPVGLDIGARTPEEIALAILAEVVAVRRGRRGGSLAAVTPAAAAGGR
ncbi:MAG TPA: XdhC/CoxI family protein [Candidatus Dormibacteraeota bacterium]|jgi:xanthine dehydrogenase accessory factor